MKFIRCLLVVLLSLVSGVVSANNSQYHIQLDLPHDWSLVSNEQDSAGYTIVYKSQHNETIQLNYGKGIDTSLKDAMQQVANVTKQLPCSKHSVTIVDERNNYLTFQVNVDGCTQAPSLLQLYKVTNRSDGQYAISYTAQRDAVSEKELKKGMSIVNRAKVN